MKSSLKVTSDGSERPVPCPSRFTSVEAPQVPHWLEGWVHPRPALARCFTPRGESVASFVLEAGCDPEPDVFNPTRKQPLVPSGQPIPVAARSRVWVCSRSVAGIAGSNPTGGMDVCLLCCLLSGRGLCDGVITRPEESYRVWCVIKCDREASIMTGPGPVGLLRQREKKPFRQEARWDSYEMTMYFTPSTLWIGDWVDPRPCLDSVGTLS
jgi:hypothetical protein